MCKIVIPWVTDLEIAAFLDAWRPTKEEQAALIFQRDAEREGCGATKNKGIAKAMVEGAEVVVILDGDCYPSREVETLSALIDAHLDALEPQSVVLYEAVTDPPSRGTPYGETSVVLPVAASMGFWQGQGDHCAVRQLALGNAPMQHRRTTVFGRYFSLCGMNIAFRPGDWSPWCRFIDVPRFDDIWMGWLWQREAYRRGHCFNLGGPLVLHARQSNVWQNLRDETTYLEMSETLWKEIAIYPAEDYDSLRKLLPC